MEKLTPIQKLKEDIRKRDEHIERLKQENMTLKGQVVSLKYAYEKLLGRLK